MNRLQFFVNFMCRAAAFLQFLSTLPFFKIYGFNFRFVLKCLLCAILCWGNENEKDRI